jgi:hypothetical protein
MNKAYVAFIGVLATLWIITIVIDVVITLALYPSRFGAIASLTESKSANPQIPIYVIIGLPEAVGLFLPPYYFWAVWIGIAAVAVAIFILVSLYRSLPKFENSSLYRIAEFFALNLFLSYIYIIFVAAIGHPIVSPIPPGPSEFIGNFFSLTNAGLYEELITRVIYIGVPLFIYYAWSSHGKNSPSRPKSLPLWRVIWGGGYRFGKPEIVVLIISSLIFGIAHAGSWDVSKIPQAALGGVFLGVLYMRFGLYADVLFHFSVDSPTVVFVNNYGDPLATSSSTFFYSLFILIFVAAGIVVAVAYLIQLGRLIERRDRSVPVPVGSAVNPSGELKDRNFGERSVICTKCGSGNVGVLYDDIYRCNSCGTVFKKAQ